MSTRAARRRNELVHGRRGGRGAARGRFRGSGVRRGGLAWLAALRRGPRRGGRGFDFMRHAEPCFSPPHGAADSSHTASSEPPNGCDATRQHGAERTPRGEAEAADHTRARGRKVALDTALNTALDTARRRRRIDEPPVGGVAGGENASARGAACGRWRRTGHAARRAGRGGARLRGRRARGAVRFRLTRRGWVDALRPFPVNFGGVTTTRSTAAAHSDDGGERGGHGSSARQLLHGWLVQRGRRRVERRRE